MPQIRTTGSFEPYFQPSEQYISDYFAKLLDS